MKNIRFIISYYCSWIFIFSGARRKVIVNLTNMVMYEMVKCTFQVTGKTENDVHVEFHNMPVAHTRRLSELKGTFWFVESKNLYNVLRILQYNGHVEYLDTPNDNAFKITDKGIEAYFQQYYTVQFLKDKKTEREYSVVYIVALTAVFTLLFKDVSFFKEYDNAVNTSQKQVEKSKPETIYKEKIVHPQDSIYRHELSLKEIPGKL